MKIVTWNVNSLKVRLPQVIAWLKENQADVLALQELKLDQDKFPLAELEAIGYQAAWNGQKTYNGVAILSKHAIEEVVYDIPHFNDPQKRVITATIQGIKIICAYCVNGEALDSDKFSYKEQWFAALSNYMAHILINHDKVILLGDFNIAPSDIDVYDPEKGHDKILCSPIERQWFQQLLNLGLDDSLRQFDSINPNYTWWDYRMNMFKRKLGLRIDHILMTPKLIENLSTVSVDMKARAYDRPSDHAPVIAVLHQIKG